MSSKPGSHDVRSPEPVPVLIWDLPIRLIHWALVALLAMSWWSAENDFQSVHVLSGYAVLALVLFRIYWGVFGSTSARFRHFVRGPAAIWSYMRHVFKRPGQISVGHNPLGALSVVLMLGLVLIQPLLGLFAKDIDGLNSGPLSHLVTFGTGRLLAELHHLVFELLLIFIFLHLLAVAFYTLYKHQNIVAAMLSGRKRLEPGAAVHLRFASLRHAAVAFGTAILFVLAIHAAGLLLR